MILDLITKSASVLLYKKSPFSEVLTPLRDSCWLLSNTLSLSKIILTTLNSILFCKLYYVRWFFLHRVVLEPVIGCILIWSIVVEHIISVYCPSAIQPHASFLIEHTLLRKLVVKVFLGGNLELSIEGLALIVMMLLVLVTMTLLYTLVRILSSRLTTSASNSLISKPLKINV